MDSKETKDESRHQPTVEEGEQEPTEDYPDGGRDAWLAALGCWCGMLAPMGWLNTLAVLQARVTQNELADLPESTTGWIMSTYAFLMFSCGVQVGPIFDSMDVKFLVIPGCIGMVLMSFLMSVCKEFYQFFLTFSILGGLSSSLLFNPCIATTSQWFCKRRALATGIICTAGGIGGIIFPLVILYGEPVIGFPWSVRIIGFISTASSVVACVLIRKRLPHNKSAGWQMDFKSLADPKFSLATLAVFLAEFAVFIPYTYISSYALHVGFDTKMAFLMNALLNAGAIPGRALPGFVADRFGAFNILGVTTFVCAALIFALWLSAASSQAAVISFAVLFGFWSGATIALSPVCISRVCKIEDYGKRSGTAYLIASIGALIGAPIAGAILKMNDGSYWGIIVFSGALYAACTVVLYFARGVAAGWGAKVNF